MLRRAPHLPEQEAHGSTGVLRSKGSLTSHAFISVSFIILYLILFSSLVRSLISCCRYTLPMVHTAFQVVSLLNRIRYIGKIGWDIFHPILFNHSCMLHSDCSGLIGKLHCHVFYCTAHGTLKGWSDESDLTKTPFLSSICALKAAYRAKPLQIHSITRGSWGSFSLYLNLMYRKPQTL